MKHIVTITVEDFQNNIYSDNFNCPLAQALKRSFPKATKVEVGADSFMIELPNIGKIYRDFESCKIHDLEKHISQRGIYRMPGATWMEDLILQYATSEGRGIKVKDLTFDFKTA